MSVDHSNGRDDTHETPICKHLETRISELLAKKPQKEPVVTAKQLERYLGLGDQPRIRRAFYRRLESEQREHGMRVFRRVWNTLKRSQSKNDPGRWFSAVIIGELECLGVWGGDI